MKQLENSLKELQSELEMFSLISAGGFNINVTSPGDVYSVLCNKFNIYPNDSRDGEFVFIRQVSHYISKILANKKHFFASLADIGREIGGRDYSTVVHSVKTINNHIDTGYRYDDISLALTIFGLSFDDLESRPKFRQYIKVKKGNKVLKFTTLKSAAEYLRVDHKSISRYISAGCKINGHKATLEIEKIESLN